jgi:hypothetical protein
VVEDQRKQHPAKDPKVPRLHTPKTGLEFAKHVVDIVRDACETPHGLGSCIVLGFSDLQKYTEALVFQEVITSSLELRRLPPVTSELLTLKMGR